jgi:hypothetical protein
MTNKEYAGKAFEAKKKFRKYQASLPIEEKVKILIELQKIGYNILKSTGRDLEKGKRVWAISENTQK